MNKLSYKTIVSESEATVKEKGSSFIAMAFPVNSLAAFESLYGKIKKQYHDASHHCYALKLADDFEKFSDNGEPSGTAGVRIMNVLNHYDLYDTAIIVTRYFGGTKLGVGPLGVAYSEAAMSCLSHAQIIEKHSFTPLTITTSFEFTNPVYRLFADYSVKIESTKFEPDVVYSVLLPTASKENFLKAFEENLRGKGKITVSERPVYK